MHYPLHITVLCTSLWVLQDDVNAAKTGVSAEVLTSFAKNVASILSSTLLSDFQDSLSNQSVSYLGSLKKSPETHSLAIGSTKTGILEATTVAPLDRLKKPAKRQAANEGGRGFPNFYPADSPQYANDYDPRFAVNPGGRIPIEAVNLETRENPNGDNRENSIDVGINPASHYQYSRPPDFRYNPELVRPLTNPNPDGPFDFQSNFQRPGISPTQLEDTERVIGNHRVNGNVQLTAIPQNINYNGPFGVPNSPPDSRSPYRHPEFFNPPSGHDEGHPLTNAQVENPSRVSDDQTQGQSALPGYNFGFHYQPHFHHGFYGHPGFHHGPHNDSFHPGPPGHNYTNGQYPYPFHNHPFHGPFVNNHDPYGHAPPPQQNAPQQASPENGQGNGNSTGHGQHHGFPGHGPFYGGLYPLGYSPGPFNVLPYHRLNPGFNGHLIPPVKVFPYFYPGPYPHFPLGPWQPFGGYYPNHNGHPPAKTPDGEKPNGEPAANGNGASEPAMNSEAEALSESRSSAIQSLSSNRNEKLLFLWPLVKGSDKLDREEILKQVS